MVGEDVQWVGLEVKDGKYFAADEVLQSFQLQLFIILRGDFKAGVVDRVLCELSPLITGFKTIVIQGFLKGFGIKLYGRGLLLLVTDFKH